MDSRGNSPVHAVMEAWNYFTIFSHNRPKYFKNEIDLLGTLQTLINNKAKVEGLNNEQKSPLQLACEYRFAPAAELLLKHGADLNRANIHGKTDWQQYYVVNKSINRIYSIADFYGYKQFYHSIFKSFNSTRKCIPLYLVKCH